MEFLNMNSGLNHMAAAAVAANGFGMGGMEGMMGGGMGMGGNNGQGNNPAMAMPNSMWRRADATSITAFRS